MRGVVMHAPGDVRVEDRPEPAILKPTDAIIRLSAACVCGSDLWPYWGLDKLAKPARWGTSTWGSWRRSVRGHHRQAGPVRRRIVLRDRQHLRDLPIRLPALLPEP